MPVGFDIQSSAHGDAPRDRTIQDELNYFKDVVLNYSLPNKLRTISICSRAISKLQKDPNCENADKIIDKTLSHIFGVDLYNTCDGPTLSRKKLESFVEILKSKGNPELNKYAEQLERNIIYYFETVKSYKKKASKKEELSPTKQENAVQPEQEPGA